MTDITPPINKTNISNVLQNKETTCIKLYLSKYFPERKPELQDLYIQLQDMQQTTGFPKK